MRGIDFGFMQDPVYIHRIGKRDIVCFMQVGANLQKLYQDTGCIFFGAVGLRADQRLVKP